MRTRLLVGVLLASSAIGAATASASAPPVGPLPTPSVTKVTTTTGALVAIALPVRAGYDWRIARAFNGKVATESTEGNVGTNVVLVFKAIGKGTTKVIVAQTRGETAKAYSAVEYDITVQ